MAHLIHQGGNFKKNQFVHIVEINELQRKLLTLSERVLPYIFYRYIIYVCKRIKLFGKELPYQDEYFLKWRPFSKEKYCIIRLEYPLYAHFAAEYAKQRSSYDIAISKRIKKQESVWGKHMGNCIPAEKDSGY